MRILDRRYQTPKPAGFQTQKGFVTFNFSQFDPPDIIISLDSIMPFLFTFTPLKWSLLNRNKKFFPKVQYRFATLYILAMMSFKMGQYSIRSHSHLSAHGPKWGFESLWDLPRHHTSTRGCCCCFHRGCSCEAVSRLRGARAWGIDFSCFSAM